MGADGKESWHRLASGHHTALSHSHSAAGVTCTDQHNVKPVKVPAWAGEGPQDATRGGIRSGQLLRGGQYSAWERKAGRLLAPQEMVKSMWAALTGLEC